MATDVNAVLSGMRRKRLSWVSMGEYRLRILRPRRMEIFKHLTEHKDRPMNRLAFAMESVVEWEGITEIDLIPGGMPEPMPFDMEVFVDWFSDRPESEWLVLIEAVDAAVHNYEQRSESDKKK